MSNAAIQTAHTLTAMVPPKPAPSLFGSRGDVGRQEINAYCTAKAAAVAAWKYAASVALNKAISLAPHDWVIDQDNIEFIKGCNSIEGLEAMCDPAYPWSGRRVDQL